ncbi:MAG: MFS transporter [Candidatus Micrarchaeota archaeon]
MNELNKSFLAVIFYSLSAGAIIVGLPLYLNSIGVSLIGIGALFGSAVLIAGVLKIAASAWTDKFGRKRLTQATSGTLVISTTLFGTLTNALQIGLVKPLYDFSSNFYWILQEIRVMDLTKPTERGKALSVFFAITGVLMAIGMFAGGFISQTLGFQAFFFAAGACSLVSTIIVWKFKESKKSIKTSIHLSLEVLKKSGAKKFAAIKILDGCACALVYTFAIPLFFQQQFNLSFEQVGLIVGSLFLVWGVSSFIHRKDVEKLGVLRIAKIISILEIIFFLGLTLITNNLFFVVVWLLLENIAYGIYPAAIGKISSLIPNKENVGRDVTLFDYFADLGKAAGLFIGGILATISFSTVFAARGIIFIAIYLLLRTLPKHLESQVSK